MVVQELAGADKSTFSPMCGVTPVAGRLEGPHCLQQKCIMGEIYTHCPRRSLPDTSSVAISGTEKQAVRALAPATPHALRVILHRSGPIRWKECPCLWLGSGDKDLSYLFGKSSQEMPLGEWGSQAGVGKQPTQNMLPRRLF